MDEDYVNRYVNPWETDVSRIIDRLVSRYFRAYNYLKNLARASREVPAKTVRDTLMEIFRWELIGRFKIPYSIDGENAVTLYRPTNYKLDMFLPSLSYFAGKFLQNSLFLIFDKFRYDTEMFDDADYFRVVDFMDKLAEYKGDVKKSNLRAFLFNNSIVYLEYKTTLFLGEKGNYFVYFRPLNPDEESVRSAMIDLYYTVAGLAGKD